MNTKPHRFVLLAVLICLLVIIPSVSAYTLLSTITTTNSTVSSGMDSFSIIDPAAFTANVTYIEVDFVCVPYIGTGGTGTETITLADSVAPFTVYGNYSVAYDTGNAPTGEARDCTFEMTKIDFSDARETVESYSLNIIGTGTGIGTHLTINAFGTGDAEPTGVNDVWFVKYGETRIYGGSLVVTPVASFNCVPTSQFPDTDVVCTDTSTNSPTDWYWSIDAEAMGIDGWMTATTQNFTWQSHFPGFYSVNLKANNSAGFDWENKTNYVSISENATPNNCNLPVASGFIRTYAQCMDSISLGVVSGCDIQLNDKEGGAWSNVTNRADGWWCIDTYPYHHIDAYGQATGYTGASNLNLPASDTITYPILLIPGYVPDAPEGEVYVFAKVSDIDTLYPIEGATVTAACSGCAITPKATNTAGVAIFTVSNQTQITFTAYKSGYTSISKTITTSDFGPDTAILEMHKQVVTPTATATTGPGGTTYPTYTPTPGPGGTMAPGYTNMQAQMWMDWLAGHGFMLIELCFFVTVCALLGFKFGK